MEYKKGLPLSSNEVVLERVLRRFGISENEYSIGFPAEQRVCLEAENGKYHVYVMERGIKFDESYHETEQEAHLKILHQLASSNAESQAMSIAYKRLSRNHNKVTAHGMKQPINVNVALEKDFDTSTIPDIFVGDTVRVFIRVKDGSRERIQTFEGTVIARKKGGLCETITVRRIAYGVGVEKVFPLNSPSVAMIEVVQKSSKHSGLKFSSYKTSSKTVQIKRKMKM